MINANTVNNLADECLPNVSKMSPSGDRGERISSVEKPIREIITVCGQSLPAIRCPQCGSRIWPIKFWARHKRWHERREKNYSGISFNHRQKAKVEIKRAG